MNCYRHPDQPAVGICLVCGRGLCAECAVEIGPLIACRQRCETEVERLYQYRQMAYGWNDQQKVGHRVRRNMRIAIGAIMVAVAWFNGLLLHQPGDSPKIQILYVALGLIGVALLLFGNKAPHTPSDPVCSKCGHNLTGNRTGRCSECGEEIKKKTSGK
jgi:hypothetical protein